MASLFKDSSPIFTGVSVAMKNLELSFGSASFIKSHCCTFSEEILFFYLTNMAYVMLRDLSL